MQLIGIVGHLPSTIMQQCACNQAQTDPRSMSSTADKAGSRQASDTQQTHGQCVYTHRTVGPIGVHNVYVKLFRLPSSF